MSLTALLLNRRIPPLPTGVGTYTHRPDTVRRAVPAPNLGIPHPTYKPTAQESHKAASRAAIIAAIRSGCIHQAQMEAHTKLSKSSVFNHCNAMVADGALIRDKTIKPYTYTLGNHSS